MLADGNGFHKGGSKTPNYPTIPEHQLAHQAYLMVELLGTQPKAISLLSE